MLQEAEDHHVKDEVVDPWAQETLQHLERNAERQVKGEEEQLEGREDSELYPAGNAKSIYSGNWWKFTYQKIRQEENEAHVVLRVLYVEIHRVVLNKKPLQVL